MAIYFTCHKCILPIVYHSIRNSHEEPRCSRGDTYAEVQIHSLSSSGRKQEQPSEQYAHQSSNLFLYTYGEIPGNSIHCTRGSFSETLINVYIYFHWIFISKKSSYISQSHPIQTLPQILNKIIHCWQRSGFCLLFHIGKAIDQSLLILHCHILRNVARLEKNFPLLRKTLQS